MRGVSQAPRTSHTTVRLATGVLRRLLTPALSGVMIFGLEPIVPKISAVAIVPAPVRVGPVTTKTSTHLIGWTNIPT